MFHVQTVSGPIAPDALGHSQIHEHIFVHRTPMAEKNPALRLDDRLVHWRSCAPTGRRGEASWRTPSPWPQDGMQSASARCRGRAAWRWRPLPATICWAFTRRTAGSTAWMRRACTTSTAVSCWRACSPGGPEPDRRPAQPTAFRRPGKGRHSGRRRRGAVRRFAAGGRRAAVRCGGAADAPHGAGGEYPAALELCFRAGLTPERLIVCHVDRQAADFGPP